MFIYFLKCYVSEKDKHLHKKFLKMVIHKLYWHVRMHPANTKLKIYLLSFCLILYKSSLFSLFYIFISEFPVEIIYWHHLLQWMCLKFWVVYYMKLLTTNVTELLSMLLDYYLLEPCKLQRDLKKIGGHDRSGNWTE